jgi:hypothetical protein
MENKVENNYYSRCLDAANILSDCLSDVRHSLLTKQQYAEICLIYAKSGDIYWVHAPKLTSKQYFEVFSVSIKVFPLSIKHLNAKKLTQGQYFELFKEAVRQSHEAIGFLEKDKLNDDQLREIQQIINGEAIK